MKKKSHLIFIVFLAGFITSFFSFLKAAEDLAPYFEAKKELMSYPPLELAPEERTKLTDIADVRKTLRIKTWAIPVQTTPEEAQAYIKQAKQEGFNAIITECNRNLFIDRASDVPDHPMGSVMGPVYEDLIKNGLMASEACHQNGLQFIIHLTSTLVNKSVIDAHKDWAMIDLVTGKPLVNAYGTYTTCISNDAFFAEFMTRLERYFGETKADGIMLDEFQFYSESTCGCDSCRKKFHESTGLSRPDLNNIRGVNVRDETTRKWFQWRANLPEERWVETSAMLKKVNPKMVHFDYLANPTSGWAYYGAGLNFHNLIRHTGSFGYEVEPPDYLYQYYTNHMIGEMKYLRSLASKANNEMWMFSYPHTKGDFIWNWFSAMSQGVKTWWMAHVPEREGMGPEIWTPLVRWEEKHEKILAPYVTVADVGLVVPRRTRDNLRLPDCIRAEMKGFMGVSNALIDAHIPYAVVLEEDLEKIENLKNFKTLMMINCATLSKSESATVQSFVQGGGVLIASGQTSLYDQEGEKLPNFQLSELFGFSFESVTEKDEKSETSLELLPSSSFLGLSAKKMSHPGFFVKLKELKPDVQVLAEFVPREGGRSPGLLMRPFGRGKVIYCSGHPEDGYFYSWYNAEVIVKGKEWKDYRDPAYLALWKSLVQIAGKPPLMIESLPVGVNAEVFQHTFGTLEGTVVLLTNFLGGALKEGIVPEDQPICFPEVKKALLNGAKSIQVQVRLSKTSRCFVFSPDFDGVVELPVKKSGDYSTVELDDLYRYSILYFSTGAMTEIDRISKGKYLSVLPKAKELISKVTMPLCGEYDPKSLYLFADSKSFLGGKLDGSDPLSVGRYIYGKDSGEMAAMTGVIMNDKGGALSVLEITGMDDNRPSKAKIEIKLNQEVIFSGENEFPNQKWGKKTFAIPAGLLKNGENQIQIQTMDSGKYGSPPWFGVNHIKISTEEKSK